MTAAMMASDAIRAEAQEVAAIGTWNPDPRLGGVIYWAVNTVNWKIYIGQSVNFAARVREHRREMRANNGPFYRSMRKYGWEAFEFVPIEFYPDQATLAAAERDAIKLYRTQDPAIGYNVADGGDGIGSACAKAIHARPDYRAYFLNSYLSSPGCPGRAVKAAATYRRNRALRLAAEANLLP